MFLLGRVVAIATFSIRTRTQYGWYVHIRLWQALFCYWSYFTGCFEHPGHKVCSGTREIASCFCSCVVFGKETFILNIWRSFHTSGCAYCVAQWFCLSHQCLCVLRCKMILFFNRFHTSKASSTTTLWEIIPLHPVHNAASTTAWCEKASRHTVASFCTVLTTEKCATLYNGKTGGKLALLDLKITRHDSSPPSVQSVRKFYRRHFE